MLRRLTLAAGCVMLFASSAYADKLYGTILHKDGSKVAKTARISTSWNSNTGRYTANGEYELDFGGKVGKKFTVYVNGDKYTEIEVKGDTRLDIRLRK